MRLKGREGISRRPSLDAASCCSDGRSLPAEGACECLLQLSSPPCQGHSSCMCSGCLPHKNMPLKPFAGFDACEPAQLHVHDLAFSPSHMAQILSHPAFDPLCIHCTRSKPRCTQSPHVHAWQPRSNGSNVAPLPLMPPQRPMQRRQRSPPAPPPLPPRQLAARPSLGPLRTVASHSPAV